MVLGTVGVGVTPDDEALGGRTDLALDAQAVVAGEDGLRVEAEIRAPAERFVTWRYADPDGPEHHSAHSSLADLRLQVRRNPGANVEFVLPMTASYELGMREADHGLEVQPYADGRP